MTALLRQKVVSRLLALAILTLCLVIVYRNGGSAPLASPQEPQAASRQVTTIIAQEQTDTPLAITGIALNAPVSSDSPFVDFGFSVVNVSLKPIRAYAIRQIVTAAGITVGGGVSLYNLQLANSRLLPHESELVYQNANAVSKKETKIIVSVDYVEFSDGTKWGTDSSKSAERAAGQRSGARAQSEKLLDLLNAGNAEDVVNVIGTGAVGIAPPLDRSSEWTEGFRSGAVIVVNRLKRAQEKGGPNELEKELRKLSKN